MKSGSKNNGIFFLLVICGLKVSGQANNHWADSVLTFLERNESLSYPVKNSTCDSLLGLFEKNNLPCYRARTLILRSYYQLNLGQDGNALTGLNSARSLLARNDCISLLSVELNLAYGNLYVHLNEQMKARYYLREGIRLDKQRTQPNKVQIELYMNLAATFSETDSQLFYNNRALTLAEKQKELRHQEIILNSIGYNYAERGMNDRAILYFRKALQVARSRNAYSSVSALYNNLAGLAGSNTETLLYIDSAIYYARLKNSLEDLQTSYQNKGFYYYENKDYKNAFDLFYESSLIKDSLYNRDKITAFADMEQKYEAELKSREIEVLQNANEVARLKASRSLGINFGLGGALLGIIFVAYAFYAQAKKKQKLNNELVIEKKKSDDLLLNILPEEIADELKQYGVAKAKQYNHVTVLFTDFVNFTGVSMSMSPTELVEEINTNFTAFDAIIERHGLEKIKTIGDAYLAVCGLPHESPDHAQRVTRAALEISHYMNRPESKFQIRIGINTGSVVAGIVGVKKYAYDIWGDTVNTAARMEQHSETGRVNISGSTYELIKGEFKCEHRGRIQAKNKGEIDMYFVTRSFNEG